MARSTSAPLVSALEDGLYRRCYLWLIISEHGSEALILLCQQAAAVRNHRIFCRYSKRQKQIGLAPIITRTRHDGSLRKHFLYGSWQTDFPNIGSACNLINLAERRRDATMAETALSQINVAFETMRDGDNVPNASYYEKQLPKARALVARLRRQ